MVLNLIIKTNAQSVAVHRCLVKQALEIRKGKAGFWQGLVRNWSDDRWWYECVDRCECEWKKALDMPELRKKFDNSWQAHRHWLHRHAWKLDDASNAKELLSNGGAVTTT